MKQDSKRKLYKPNCSGQWEMGVEGYMEEKRQHQRYETNIDVKLRFQDHQIPCRIKNLSEGGSLLLIDPESSDLLTQACVGEETTFQLNSVQTTGTIVRFFESEGTKLVALRFQGHSMPDEVDKSQSPSSRS